MEQDIIQLLRPRFVRLRNGGATGFVASAIIAARHDGRLCHTTVNAMGMPVDPERAAQRIDETQAAFRAWRRHRVFGLTLRIELPESLGDDQARGIVLAALRDGFSTQAILLALHRRHQEFHSHALLLPQPAKVLAGLPCCIRRRRPRDQALRQTAARLERSLAMPTPTVRNEPQRTPDLQTSPLPSIQEILPTDTNPPPF